MNKPKRRLKRRSRVTSEKSAQLNVKLKIKVGPGGRRDAKLIKIPRAKATSDGKGTFLSSDEADQIMSKTWITVVKLASSLLVKPVEGWLNRLKSWFMRMARGNYDPHRTKIWEGYTFPQLVKFMQTFVSARKRAVVKAIGPYFYDLLYAIEAHQAEKISPRGCFPDVTSGWLEEFFDRVYAKKPKHSNLDPEAWKRVMHRIATLYKGPTLDVTDSTRKQMWAQSISTEGTQSESALNTNTNSCWPDFVKHWFKALTDKSATLAQKLVTVKIRKAVDFVFDKVLEGMSWKALLQYLHFQAVANQRTNVGSGPQGEENTYKGKWMSKLRGVVAMPKLDTCLGKILYIVMLPAIRTIVNRNGAPIFLGLFHPAQIDKACQWILETADSLGQKPLSIDYSAFDTSVPPWVMIDVAWAVARWMSPKMQNLWLALVYAFVYQTSIISLQKVYPEAESSVKSGSWLTNLIDSLVNLAVQFYGEEIGSYKCEVNVVHGDDGILVGKGVTPKTYQIPADVIGLTANADKQYCEAGALAFCQKVHFKGLPGGIYPISRCTAAVVSLEDDGPRIETENAEHFPYVVAFRTICRMETAAFNPLFADYVKAVCAEPIMEKSLSVGLRKLAYFAGSYADKMLQYIADKPWKGLAMAEKGGFMGLATTRVLSGENPPRPGKELFNWVYKTDYDGITMRGPDSSGNWNLPQYRKYA
jgi:hypothetical protein